RSGAGELPAADDRGERGKLGFDQFRILSHTTIPIPLGRMLHEVGTVEEDRGRLELPGHHPDVLDRSSQIAVHDIEGGMIALDRREAGLELAEVVAGEGRMLQLAGRNMRL